MSMSRFRKVARKLVFPLAAGGMMIGSFLTISALRVNAQQPDKAATEAKVAEIVRLHEEFARAPKFVGTLNGFQFFDPSDLSRQGASWHQRWSPKCSGSNLKEVSGEVGRTSKLQFQTTYLPPGMTPLSETVNSCEDDVVFIYRDFASILGGRISFLRYAGPPVDEAVAGANYLVTQSVGGRQAVITKQIIDRGSMLVLMHEQGSYYRVSCVNLTADECVKAAAGVR